MVIEGRRKLVPRTTGPYTVQSVTKSTVTIVKDEVTVPLSLDRVTDIPRVPDDLVPSAGLDNTRSQSKVGMQGNINEHTFFLPNPSDPERAEYAIDHIFGHRGTGKQTEYKVWWYGYGAEENTYEPATKLPVYFTHLHRTTRRPEVKKSLSNRETGRQAKTNKKRHLYLTHPQLSDRSVWFREPSKVVGGKFLVGVPILTDTINQVV